VHETYVPIGVSYGWPMHALCLGVLIFTVMTRLRRRQRVRWVDGCALALLALIWILHLPAFWSLGLLWGLMVSNPRVKPGAEPDSPWSKRILMVVAITLGAFWVWIGFDTGAPVTLTDTAALIGQGHRGAEALPRAFATVSRAPHPFWASPRDATWRLSGHHGSRLFWMDTYVFWGPHGLTTGAQLGKRVQQWAPEHPIPVRPQDRKFVEAAD